MEPDHSRLVVEIPTTVYDELDWLQKHLGRYKKTIVADQVHQLFLREQRKLQKEIPDGERTEA